MIPSTDDKPAAEETLRGDIEIAPHALKSGLLQTLPEEAEAESQIPQPQRTTAARPGTSHTLRASGAKVDPKVKHRARSWLSGPDEPSEPGGPSRPQAAWAKAREAVDAGFDRAWVWGRRTREDVRESLRHRDRWFAWKAGIVAGWVLLSVVSLGVAASGGESQPAKNRLDAYMVVRPSSLGWALMVENRSSRVWNQVEIEVEGFTYRQVRVLPDERLVLGPSQFGTAGAEALAKHPPQRAKLASTEGTVEIAFTP